LYRAQWFQTSVKVSSKSDKNRHRESTDYGRAQTEITQVYNVSHAMFWEKQKATDIKMQNKTKKHNHDLYVYNLYM